MLAPRSDAPPRRKVPAKLNLSSRTKTSRSERKQNKKRISLDDTRLKVESLCQSGELLLPKLLDDQEIESLLRELCPDDTTSRRNRIFTIPVTLTLFVQQVLSKDCGCKAVIAMLNKQRKKDNLSEVSTNTTSYCEARMRLPLPLIVTLMRHTADLAFSNLRSDWRWFGHRVLLVDGLVVHAPDTPANQEVFPQPHSQLPGMGFPQVRVCASICLTSGVVTDVQYGPVEGKKTGEATLFRQMFSKFMPGDIIVADSNFECYRDLAMLKSQGVYMVCNMNGTRTSPFTGTCQVIEETIKTLPRPEFDKSRFTREEWDRLPETLDVRIIRYKVRGRKPEVILVTTLLDQKTYPAKAIAKLYKQRWECELDIRSIKTVMGMTWLSCHTPEMLERELMVYFLAYNLVRVSMFDAARVSDRKPRDLSFKNAKDSWLNLTPTDRTENDYAWLLWSIADAPLRKRPGRNEPRKIKRRCNKYEKMKLPRAQEKAALSP
jgi:hypothetical protein